MRKWAITASVTVGMALLLAAPSYASITLGQLTPAGNPFGCGDGSYIVQTGVAGGPDYRVPPGGGVITGWKGRTFSTGGADQILQLAVIGDNVSGDAVTFEALSDFEHLAPVAPSGRIYSFTTRISVDGGERIGLYAKDTSGPEAFTWGCAVPTGSGNADRDIWGALTAPVIGGPPAPATFGQFLSQRVPVEATLEADADNDGFGDETQDACPQSAATQAACPIVKLSASTTTTNRAVTVLLTGTSPANVTVNGKVSLGKGKKAKLKGGTKAVAPGTFTKFKLKFPAKLIKRLQELPPSKKLTLKVTSSAPNVAAAPTKKTIKVKLKGQD
jgi:hypothetical protein